MAALIPLIMFIAGLLAAGLVALNHDRYYPLGIGMLILAGILAFFVLNISSIRKRYLFTMEQCPEKGKAPQWGRIKRGYRWYASYGDDMQSEMSCTRCGYCAAIPVCPAAYAEGTADPALIPLHP